MPSYSGSYNPVVGPIVELAIFPLPDVPGTPVDASMLRIYSALIDTGASATCVSQRVVQEMKLKPAGKVPMLGATGQKVVNHYPFLVSFFQQSGTNADGTANILLSHLSTRGMEFDVGGANFDVLLGRDILCRGVFTLSFDGHWLFSF